MQPQQDALLQSIAAELVQEPLTVFAGAGLSRNAGIPIALEMQNAILRQLGFDDSDIGLFFRANLPFEAFFEVLLGATNCEALLRVFQRGTPTRNHVLLAKLARHRLLTTVVTTNFDLLIETAFAGEGVALQEYTSDESLADVPWSSSESKLVKLHGSIKNIDAVAVSIRRVAAQRYVANRANAIRRMLTETQGRILIFGYSCSDRFDISPAIRSIRDSLCRIIYVCHTDERNVVQRQSLVDLNPEHVLASLVCEHLTCNADDFVEALWRQSLSEPVPGLEASGDAWHEDVNLWVSGLGNNAKGFTSYLCGLLQKAANNWSRSNELIELSVSLGLDDLLCTRSYLALGNNHRDLNELSSATDNLNLALTDAKAHGFIQEETRALNSLGIVAADRKDYDAAIELYEKAIQKAQIGNDQELEGKCHGNIGILLKNRNKGTDLMDALIHQIQALRLSREIGDKRSEGRTLGNIGIAYSDLGYKHVAQGFYAEAKEIAVALGDLLHVGIWLHNAGEDALSFDRPLAERLLHEAMKTFRDLGKEHLAQESESLLRPPKRD